MVEKQQVKAVGATLQAGVDNPLPVGMPFPLGIQPESAWFAELCESWLELWRERAEWRSLNAEELQKRQNLHDFINELQAKLGAVKTELRAAKKKPRATRKKKAV